MIFKVKQDGRHKARLVAGGHMVDPMGVNSRLTVVKTFYRFCAAILGMLLSPLSAWRKSTRTPVRSLANARDLCLSSRRRSMVYDHHRVELSGPILLTFYVLSVSQLYTTTVMSGCESEKRRMASMIISALMWMISKLSREIRNNGRHSSLAHFC